MQNLAVEKQLSKLLAFGAALTTIFLISGSVTDPVNTPKFLIIGLVSASSIGLVMSTSLRSRFKQTRTIAITLAIFVAAMAVSVFSSKSPISQNFYGSYGRNNGFIAYLFLALILCSSLVMREVSSFKLLVKALLFAGIVNVVYCLWVILFGDFIGWSNPYGNILGTFGNPDFISAFLGFFFAAYLAHGVSKESNKTFRYSMLLVLPISAYEIVSSHAIQGRLVAVLGTGVVGLLYLRSRFNSKIVAAYSVFSVIAGVLAVAGALQIGPLTKYIYKTSVSLRGQYWLAAWNTGKSHPITGVGMDAFGDWYRRSRDLHAIVLPGVNTVVNTAHNVWLDMFAFGGWPLLLSYLAIITMTAVAIVKVVLRKKDYDSTFVALTVAWIGYQAQSIISINQLGLAIWGWVLSGALIGYERASREKDPQVAVSGGKRASKANQNGQQSLGVMVATISGLVGLLIALPPLLSDAKWRSAQLARTAQGIETTMQSAYFNPLNTYKYVMNIQQLESSNLFDLSHKYALEGVKWNPESYDLWRALYFIKNSSADERASALENMKRLDPLNPDATSTK
jgi:O-antigen ligase